MNKTIDINLAGFLFHIDEEAYALLKQYLEAVETSLSDDPGKEEIMNDIEARIAELFFEKQVFKTQVINSGMVEEIITVMGGPEDYKIDDTVNSGEKTEAETKNTNPPKKLYRDANDAYAGGVSSGLGYYFNIEAFWIRLAWVLLTIFTSGSFILIYFGFWLFVPKANTTSEQLEMKGHAVNLSNIGKTVRSANENIQRKSASFFENAGEIIKKLIIFLVKFFGAYLVFIAAVSILATLIAIVSIFVFKAGQNYWYDTIDAANIGISYQLIGLPILLFVAIPMFFLGLFGMRILINRTTKINKSLLFSLIALWILSGVSLGVFLYNECNERSQEAFVHDTTEIPFSSKDTLNIIAFSDLNNVKTTNLSKSNFGDDCHFSVDYSTGKKRILLHKTYLYVKPSYDNKTYLKISKSSKGENFETARKNAEAIAYEYKLEGNKLMLFKDASTAFENEWKDQRLYVNLFIPEGMSIIANESTITMNRNAWDETTSLNHKEGKVVTMTNKQLICDSCDTSETLYDKNNSNFTNSNGVNLNFNDGKDSFHVKIDESGVHINGKSDDENFKLDIDESGIEINGKQP